MWFIKRKIRFVLFSIALLGHALPALSGTTIHDVTFSNSAELLLTDSQNTSLGLSAMGQDMVLHLTPSRFNAMALEHSEPSTTLKFFEGTIEGDAASWVRLSVMRTEPKNAFEDASSNAPNTLSNQPPNTTSNEKLNGQLFFNGTLYQLENQDYLRTVGVEHTSTSEHVLLHTQNNASGQDLLQGYLPPQDLIQFAPASSFRQRSIFDTPAFDESAYATRTDDVGTDGLGTFVTKALRVGIYVDSRFNEAHQGRGLSRALSIMSGVDAIYQAQLGIAVIVESISLNDDPETDPMRNKSGTVGQILEEFRLVRQADKNLPADLSMVHLFTGHRDTDRTIGLGWKSTTCRIDGYDISVSTVFPFDTLLAAHELAHNLGAVHDDDLRCSAQAVAEENALMWPSISGSSTSEFSSCSIAFMQNSKDESCNANSIDAAVKIYSTPINNGLGENFQRSVIIKVSNQDPLGRATELFSTTEFPVGTIFNNVGAGCFVNNTSIDCNHGTVAAYGESSVSVTATLLDHGDETVVSNVELLNAVDIRNYNNRAAISVLQDQVSLDQPIAAGTTLFQDDASGDPKDDDVISLLGMPSWWSLLALGGLFGFRVRAHKLS